jgi:predicted outer membrane repeat protein
MWGAVPKTGLVVPILLLVMAGGALGRIIYVDADAIGANNGSSWSDAYIYIQDALADANLSGDVNQIRVAQGIYRPDQNSVYPDGTGVREATFQLINGVSLKGGYAGLGEPDPNERNIQLYETILSGDLNGDDGPDFDDYDENSYHVVTGSGTDGNAVLDGFTITAGNADGYDLAELGAGMYNDGGSPMVMDCNFTWNMAGSGGGVSNRGGSNPKMVRCRFVSNTAENYGGAMYNYKSSPVLINCEFSENSCCGFGYCFSVCMGAAVCNIESDCTIINCTFEGNWLNSMYSNRGGGVYSYKGELTLENCTFSENRAVSFKPGYIDTLHAGGGVYTVDVADGNVVNCTFVGNLAGAGGGILNNSKNVKVTNCTFMENSAKHFDGGAVYSSRSATFSDCGFVNNSANRDGGGVYNRYGSNLILTNCAFADNLAGASGGGFCDNRSHGTELINCMFSGNWANSGGGIFNDSENVKVTKCTFMENVAEDFDGGAVYNSGSATFSYCNFISNWAQGDGGGMCNSSGTDLMLTNCVFTDNLAGASGGGFYDYKSLGTEVINCIFSGNSAELAGGGMYNESYIPNLVNCTFSRNSAVSSGGAMYNKYTSYGEISAALTNCTILQLHGPAINNLL